MADQNKTPGTKPSASGRKRKAPSGAPKARRAAGSGGEPRKKIGVGRMILRILGIIILATLLVVTSVSLWFYNKTELPNPNEEFMTQTTTLLYGDGETKLGDLAVQNRTVITYDQMPQTVKDAVVAAEDRSFWTNKGIDIKGMTRAAMRILRGDDLQGGSTITQQYIKILYLTTDQTMSRKFKELVLAMKMNKAESKEYVLSGYLNTIYFGRNAYGIQAAAETYFGIPASDLNLPQSVVLASVINSPASFDPANGEEAQAALVERYNYVLDGMLEMGTISQADYDAAYNQLPEIKEPTTDNVFGGPNGFLIRMAMDELIAHDFTEEQITGGGWTIVTTFDHHMQNAAIDAVNGNVAAAIENALPVRNENGEVVLDEAGNPVKPDPAQLHTGLASIEINSGEVKALYGGPDFVNNSRNWATTPRYAGSTFKVYGIISGLRNGFGLQSLLRGSTFTPPGDSVTVNNDSMAQYGPLTLEMATVYSSNTAFVDMMTQIPNQEEVLTTAATDAGVPKHPSWEGQGTRMVLGEGEVSALGNATGFATIANNGKRHETHVVREVKDASGTVIYTGNTDVEQGIEDAVARDTTYALSRSAEAAQRNAVGCQVAGKTGTEGTQIGQEGVEVTTTRAAWLAGFTKQLATAVVMVAGEDGNQNLDPYAAWGGTFYGAGYPTSIWSDYMARATEGMECLPFDPPANIRPSVQNTLAPPPPPSVEPSEEAKPSEEPTAAEGDGQGQGPVQPRPGGGETKPPQPVQPPETHEPEPPIGGTTTYTRPRGEATGR